MVLAAQYALDAVQRGLGFDADWLGRFAAAVAAYVVFGVHVPATAAAFAADRQVQAARFAQDACDGGQLLEGDTARYRLVAAFHGAPTPLGHVGGLAAAGWAALAVWVAWMWLFQPQRKFWTVTVALFLAVLLVIDVALVGDYLRDRPRAAVLPAADAYDRLVRALQAKGALPAGAFADLLAARWRVTYPADALDSDDALLGKLAAAVEKEPMKVVALLDAHADRRWHAFAGSDAARALFTALEPLKLKDRHNPGAALHADLFYVQRVMIGLAVAAVGVVAVLPLARRQSVGRDLYMLSVPGRG